MLPDAAWNEWDARPQAGLNAPTGAWCSLTARRKADDDLTARVSMHLQVRGAP